jgi:hypothetical protein
MFIGLKNKLILACYLMPTLALASPCEQQALEAAGQAMSNVQYNLTRYNDYQALINCSSANGCPLIPLKSGVDNGAVYGKYSQTSYHGLSPRQAYDGIKATCGR